VRDAILGGGSAQGKVMCDRLASAWVAFARTGDPNNPQLPPWPAYDEATRATMIFDTDTRLENDPRAEIRKFWAARSSARSTPG
jgi:para-nitrobenzyl esterase